jgi:hypothetical protein
MPHRPAHAALFAVILAACSAAPFTPHPPAGNADAGGEPSFAALRSSVVLAAAMSYPTLKVAEAPPLSLTASDGTGLKLVALDGRAVVDGPLAFTELRLRFDNPEDRVIEGRFAVTLPPSAAISRLAMRSPEGWQEAEVVERQLARQAYEDALHRRQDPALLEKEAGNEFRARIFPIPARGSKDIIVSYSQEIRAGQPYRLPLRGLPEVAQLQVGALTGKSKAELSKTAWKPDRDFEVAVPAGSPGLRSDDLVAVRVRPEFGSQKAPVQDLVVLFDTSASRALGFSREVARLGQLVAALGKDAAPDARLTVATFDQTVDPIYRGPLSGFAKQHLDLILARRPLGASDLPTALSWLGRTDKVARAVLLTDAIVTAGPADAAAFAARALRGKIERIDVVLTGGIRDEDTARRVARAGLENDGVVLDGAADIGEIARRLALTTRSGISVQIPGSKWSWPETIDGAQPGDEVLVYARMDRSALASGKALPVVLSGSIAQKLEVPLAQVAKPLLERAAASAEIARLAAKRERLTVSDAREREALQHEIVRISTRFRVVTDFTALLVLETERDYERFGIDRRALADILTVGERGIEVVHRTAPTLAVAAQPPPQSPAQGRKTPAKEKPDKDGGESAREVSKKSETALADAAPNSRPAAQGPRPSIAARPAPKPAMTADAPAESAPASGAPGGAPMRPGMQPALEPRAAATASPAAAPPPPPLREPEPESPAGPQFAPSAQLREMMAPPRGEARDEEEEKGPPPYTGKMAAVMDLLAGGKVESAIVDSLRWQTEDPGDVMALVALGESLEAAGQAVLAARTYGSILDLFPTRADMRRFAAERLDRIGARRLASDAYAKAAADRPDHLHGHHLLAFALVREGRFEEAFAALEAGISREYPGGRFAGGDRVLREDLGLVAAAWLNKEPNRRAKLEARLARFGVEIPAKPSLRFVLVWETDANDVDFHIRDGKGGHAWYNNMQLKSGGELYADVTTGYGPECFTIEGAPSAYPYRLSIHYYSRGPMGYGMGKLQVIEHDGRGGLRLEERPFVVMNDHAYVNLGEVRGPLGLN